MIIGTSPLLKSSVTKLFSVHTKTHYWRFQMVGQMTSFYSRKLVQRNHMIIGDSPLLKTSVTKGFSDHTKTHRRGFQMAGQLASFDVI